MRCTSKAALPKPTAAKNSSEETKAIKTSDEMAQVGFFFFFNEQLKIKKKKVLCTQKQIMTFSSLLMSL